MYAQNLIFFKGLQNSKADSISKNPVSVAWKQHIRFMHCLLYPIEWQDIRDETRLLFLSVTMAPQNTIA